MVRQRKEWDDLYRTGERMKFLLERAMASQLPEYAEIVAAGPEIKLLRGIEVGQKPAEE